LGFNFDSLILCISTNEFSSSLESTNFIDSEGDDDGCIISFVNRLLNLLFSDILSFNLLIVFSLFSKLLSFAIVWSLFCDSSLLLLLLLSSMVNISISLFSL